MDVSEAMAQMHGVFFEVRNGVEEIQHGADDIVDRALEVNELSTENARGIEALSMSLERFMTTDTDFDDVRTKRNEPETAAGEVNAAAEPEIPETAAVEIDADGIPALDEVSVAETSEENPFGEVEKKEEEKHRTYTSEPKNQDELFDYFLS